MTNNIQKAILKGSVACVLALMATNAKAAESFIRNDGSVNWPAVDNLQAIDKSLSRQYMDTMTDWAPTIMKEDEENKANLVQQQVSEIAHLGADMASANQALSAANQRVAEIMANIARLEQEKADIADNPYSQFALGMGGWGEAIGLSADPIADMQRQQKQAEIDRQLEEAKQAMADAEAQRDRANLENEKLRALEAQLDPELSQMLLGEALQSGIPLDQLDAAMADPTARAALQQDLDSMYDKYLSDVPKVDLDTPEGQAYAKSFLTALSGQTQAGESNNIPSYMLSGNAAIDDYQRQRDLPSYLRTENGGFVGSESQIQPQNQAAPANESQSATSEAAAGNSAANNQSASDVVNQRMLEAARANHERELAAAQNSLDRDLQKAQESYDRQVQQLSGSSVGGGSRVQSTH